MVRVSDSEETKLLRELTREMRLKIRELRQERVDLIGALKGSGPIPGTAVDYQSLASKIGALDGILEALEGRFVRLVGALANSRSCDREEEAGHLQKVQGESL